FHVQLAAFAHRRDVHVLVQNFHIAIGFDHAGGDNARLVGTQVDRLRTFTVQLERHLLQVKDDVGRILHHARDRLELVQHTLDLYGCNGGAFDRAQQYTTQDRKSTRLNSSHDQSSYA